MDYRFGRRTPLLVFVFAALCAGCTTRQDITKLEGPKPGTTCIVRNGGVKPGVLEAMQDGFARHNMPTRVINGQYNWDKEKRQVTTRVTSNDTEGCDAVTYYHAQWSWDLATYMYFANIWMTTGNGKRIAQATYDASKQAGPDKFIDARVKILELMDQMLAGL